MINLSVETNTAAGLVKNKFLQWAMPGKTRCVLSSVLIGAGALLASALIAGTFSSKAMAQASNNGTEVKIQRGVGLHAGEFVVALNKSQILRLDVPFTNISIGNPKIADVLALTDRTMYILGKGLGSTSLTIFGPKRKLIAIADLTVTYDIEGIKARLHDLLPAEKLEVRTVGDSVVLAGFVSSAAAADRAMKIATRFAPGKVTNLMRVRSAQQVMLQVRFSEVQRSAMKAISSSLAFKNGGSPSGFPNWKNGLSDLVFGSGGTVASNFISGTLGLRVFGLSMQALFSALETKGFSRTLAEPTLVALSGGTARFLAGGEYPIRTTDGDGNVNITFKEFGVSIEFTPTVLDRNRINLVVTPVVSSLDFNLASQIADNSDGIEKAAIPPLSTRSAKTTVELGDGQSFAIAGLIQNDFDNSISQVPWLANVPVLGALMRSSDFQRQETELVMVVTPYIVKPISADQVVLPTDRFLPPSEQDFFLMGHIRKDVPNVAPTSGPGGRINGGIAGGYGHIVE